MKNQNQRKKYLIEILSIHNLKNLNLPTFYLCTKGQNCEISYNIFCVKCCDIMIFFKAVARFQQ